MPLSLILLHAVDRLSLLGPEGGERVVALSSSLLRKHVIPRRRSEGPLRIGGEHISTSASACLLLLPKWFVSNRPECIALKRSLLRGERWLLGCKLVAASCRIRSGEHIAATCVRCILLEHITLRLLLLLRALLLERIGAPLILLLSTEAELLALRHSAILIALASPAEI